MALSNKKKILVFTDWYEPGFKGGGPIRSAVNFVKNMRDHYEIFIFTSDRDHGDVKAYENVDTDQWISINGASVFYASPQFLGWANISREIKQAQPDLIYLNSMYSRYFAIYPLLMKRFHRISAKLILAPRGMLQQGALKFKKGKKVFFLQLLNLLGVPSHIYGHATDAQEKKDMLQHLPALRAVTIIPNFSSAVANPPIIISKTVNQVKAVFISRIAAKKNLLFLLNLLKEFPPNYSLQLTILGSVEDAAYWEQCNALIQQLPRNISVTYAGAVENEKVLQHIQQHHLFVLPTLGENFGHAIFEALAAGRPVLISDQTPWRDLEPQKAGWDLPLSNPEAFNKAIENIAEMDEEMFELWCRGAWEYAKRFSSEANLKKQYLELFS